MNSDLDNYTNIIVFNGEGRQTQEAEEAKIALAHIDFF